MSGWHLTVYASAYTGSLAPTLEATAVALEAEFLGAKQQKPALANLSKKLEKRGLWKEKLTSWDLERTVTDQLQGHRNSEPGLWGAGTQRPGLQGTPAAPHLSINSL